MYVQQTVFFNRQQLEHPPHCPLSPPPHTHKELYALKKLCKNAADSFDFEITCMTSDQVTLECSVQLPSSVTLVK